MTLVHESRAGLRRATMIRALLILGLFAPVAGLAEIEKDAVICESAICFRWWPKLPAVEGWHHDDDYSLEHGINAQAPDGETFAQAETVIYANAVYKPRAPDTKSLVAFIESDQGEFRAANPGIEIRAADALETAEGAKLGSFTYTPSGVGNFERVSYGEEADYWLVFVVSARSSKGLEAAMGAYRKFIAGYRAGRDGEASAEVVVDAPEVPR